MMMHHTSLRLLCFAGATGTGKTDAALFLARMLKTHAPNGCVIINADSRQLYRDFPLITAQPSPVEQAQCPHQLYGTLKSTEKMSAGIWASQAAQAISQCATHGSIPILVGGTGLYMRALFDGIVDIPPIPPDISAYWAARLQRESSPALHAELGQRDPEYAARIHPNDPQRILRALEVLDATGKTFSWWHSQPRQSPLPPCRVLQLGLDLPLDELSPRLALRIDAMLAVGAEAEARAALAHCPDPTAPGWSGIGCIEMYQYLQGSLNLAELRILWLKNTRAYAKRQRTWFRADPRIHWFSPGAYAPIEECVRTWWNGVEEDAYRVSSE